MVVKYHLYLIQTVLLCNNLKMTCQHYHPFLLSLFLSFFCCCLTCFECWLNSQKKKYVFLKCSCVTPAIVCLCFACHYFALICQVSFFAFHVFFYVLAHSASLALISRIKFTSFIFFCLKMCNFFYYHFDCELYSLCCVSKHTRMRVTHSFSHTILILILFLFY